MREGYITFVKKYINLHPEYKNNLKAIKESLISFGATEEEFNEAMRQINLLPVSSNQSLISKLKLPDISFKTIKRTATATLVFLAFISVIYTTFIYQKPNTPTKTPLAITNIIDIIFLVISNSSSIEYEPSAALCMSLC